MFSWVFGRAGSAGALALAREAHSSRYPSTDRSPSPALKDGIPAKASVPGRRMSIRSLRGWCLILTCFALPSGALAAGAGQVQSVANDLEVLPAKLEKKTLQVSPRVYAVSRDRLLRTSILAETGLTQLKAQTTYNAISGELSYHLGYGYRTRPVVVGFSVFDRVEFVKTVAGLRFIGRERRGSVNLTAPLRGRSACLLSLSGGEYTSILAVKPPRMVLHEQTFVHEWSLGIFPVYQGARVTFKEGVKFAQGDFSYRAVEAEAGWRVPDDARRWVVRARVTAGAPISRRGIYPVYEWYYLGGQETLPGWALYEWEGESAVFGNAGIRIPFLTEWNPRKRRLWLSELSAVAYLHFAGVGGEEVFRETRTYRVSVTAGPRIGFGLPGGTAVHLQGEWAHPVHAGRRDVFYLTLAVS